MLGLALAPDFEDSGSFYVYYSAADPLRTVLSRYLAGPEEEADRASEEVILEIPQVGNLHQGGQIAFGPDGFLYLSAGDAGAGRDSQDLSSLAGKILRIDVSSESGEQAYTIPGTNPFLDKAEEGVRPEIWANGLRNPWRFSFDSETGELWVGNVGADS